MFRLNCSLESIEKYKENAIKYNYESVGTWIGPNYYISIVKPEDIQVSLYFLKPVNHIS